MYGAFLDMFSITVLVNEVNNIAVPQRYESIKIAILIVRSFVRTRYGVDHASMHCM